jgi:hypothetical protein
VYFRRNKKWLISYTVEMLFCNDPPALARRHNDDAITRESDIRGIISGFHALT